MDAANQSAAVTNGLNDVLSATNMHVGLSAATLTTALSAQLPAVLTSTSSAGQSTSIPYLPWPPQQPTINVPFFDANLYKTVNLDVQPSCLPNGMDLPLNDITTLR